MHFSGSYNKKKKLFFILLTEKFKVVSTSVDINDYKKDIIIKRNSLIVFIFYFFKLQYLSNTYVYLSY